MSVAAPTGAGFQQALVALHEQQIAKQPMRTEKGKVQQYEGSAAAQYRYVETR